MGVRVQEYGSALGRAIGRLFQAGSIPAFYLNGNLTPVLDVERLLWEPAIITGVANANGNGVVTVVTVPKGERWRLKDYQAAVATGTMNIDVLYAYEPGGANGCPIDRQTAATFMWSDLAENPVLETGWTLGVEVVSHSVNGTVTLQALIERQRVIG